MKNIVKINMILCGAILALTSCQQPGKNVTGSEYVPDMAHSVAYESNVYDYFYYNRWGTRDELHKMSSPRLPVNGTVPRSEASSALTLSNQGLNSKQGRAIPANGSVPYYYGDNEEDRARAMAEIINNPYPITAAGLATGKELYEIFCATCHGEKGDGAGYLVRDGGKYPAQPANFLLEEHLLASNGRYYHAIMHGRNLMGNYKDKMSYSERWQVIHYIRSLQATETKLTYNEKENTFNTTDVPGAVLEAKKAALIASEKSVSTTETKVTEVAKAAMDKNHGEKH